MKAFRLLLVIGALATTGRADVADRLSALIGYTIVEASSVREAERVENGSGRNIRLANGQIWQAQVMLTPLIADTVVVFEKAGAYVVLVAGEVAPARLVRGTLQKAPKQDAHGVTAETYELLAQKLEASGDRESAALARARAAKMR